MNESLYGLFSFPLTICIIMNVERIIGVACMILFFSEVEGFEYSNLMFLLHPLISWAYIVFLAKMNGQIKVTLETICQILRRRHRRLVRITGNDLALLNHRPARKAYQMHELQLYLPYFEIRLFNLAQLDLAFVLKLAIFAISYIIFFVQTN